MVLQRFIKFIAAKAVEGSAEHERELQNAADQFPELVDDVIVAYIDATTPVAIEDLPLLPEESDTPESAPAEEPTETASNTEIADLVIQEFVHKPAKRPRTVYPRTAPMDAKAPDGYLWCSHCRTYKTDDQFTFVGERYNENRLIRRRGRRTYCSECGSKQY